MSETPVSPAAQGQSDRAASNRALRTKVRLGLFGLLFLMIVALAWDRLGARPAVEQAYETVENLNAEIVTAAVPKVMTSADVRQALGRQPSKIEQRDGYTVEIYRWPAGLPWRSHDYYVVYTGEKELRFNTHFKFEYPQEPGAASAEPVAQESGSEEEEPSNVDDADAEGPSHPAVAEGEGPSGAAQPKATDSDDAAEPPDEGELTIEP